MFNRKYIVVFLFLIFALCNATEVDTSFFRAVHMGGNWGRTPFFVQNPPQDYFDFLDSLNVNWVGISVSLHISDSMDSTVERKYTDVTIPTFRDEDLIRIIREFRNRKYHVYLTLAFETADAEQAPHPVSRWQLGDPKMHIEDPNIVLEYWPWALEHPEHERFVNKFWASYTKQALHFADICEAEGVELYSLGTETNRLFRTRTEGYWSNNYRSNIRAMADTVKEAYGGLLTYDMHYSALTDTGFFSLSEIWQDIGLDIIGISAYFPLTDTPPDTIMDTTCIDQSWNTILNENLKPLHEKYPHKPILFLEFGYVDALGSPYMPSVREFETKFFEDSDGNGLDDGEETQNNIYNSFFNINRDHGNMVSGAFLWGHQMASNIDWENSFGKLRGFSVRDKLSEQTVCQHYAQHISLPDAPELISPVNNYICMSDTCLLVWQNIEHATSYRMQLSKDSMFTLELKDKHLTDTVFIARDIENNTDYYWRVKALNRSIESEWSELQKFSGNTVGVIGIKPDNFILEQNYPNPFNPATAINWKLSTGSDVDLSIYDLSGRKIATLLNEVQPAGYHSVKWNAAGYNSGIYFYRLTAGEFADTKKMVLIK